MARLKELYDKEIRKNLVEKFGYKNVNMAPRIEKIVINTCSRDALQTSKTLEFMRNDLTQISGQKAVIAKAKKSVAAFKLREGQAIGSYVTLRGKRMYEFLDRFISVSLPRVR
ncbi:MAG: 50S ribosomal protein L5, partial [Bdellovibrionales bacterium]|nr:50S ribosomal protein L5 [Bdellovibrionales bacterium]